MYYRELPFSGQASELLPPQSVFRLKSGNYSPKVLRVVWLYKMCKFVHYHIPQFIIRCRYQQKVERNLAQCRSA